MIDISTLRDVERALADLPDRRIRVGVFCEHRDKHAAEGNRREAALWQSLAVALAEITDEERAVLRNAEPPLNGAVEI